MRRQKFYAENFMEAHLFRVEIGVFSIAFYVFDFIDGRDFLTFRASIAF